MDLVNNILFLQELELITPHVELVIVGELVAAAVGDVQHKSAECDLRLKIDISPALPKIHADADGLGRAISALLDNAIKTGGPSAPSAAAKEASSPSPAGTRRSVTFVLRAPSSRRSRVNNLREDVSVSRWGQE